MRLPSAFSDVQLKSGCVLYLPLVGVSESTVNTNCSSGLQLQFDFAPMTEIMMIKKKKQATLQEQCEDVID